MWPQVAAELGRRLRRRGLRPEDTDDVVQEVAVRALACRLAFESAQDLARWANVVARNLAVDLRRASARIVLVPDAGEPPVYGDVEALVELRWDLAALVAAWGRLSPADRTRLAADLTGTTADGRRDQNRLAVRRHRARRRLAELVRAAQSPGRQPSGSARGSGSVQPSPVSDLEDRNEA